MAGEDLAVPGAPAADREGLRFGPWALGALTVLVVGIGAYTVGRADQALEVGRQAAQDAAVAQQQAVTAQREAAELRNDIRALVGRIDQLISTDRRRVSAGGS